jgi:cytochrome c oxidase subunit 3
MTLATAAATAGGWQPSRGRLGTIGLIVAESSLFAVFVVAYLFYIGKSLSGPSPRDVLAVPVFNTVCLLSSSLTVALGVRAIRRDDRRRAGLWFLVTALLGTAVLTGTLVEWHRLIYQHGLTISTNLFGTTFYSLVGFHAGHVTVGLVLLILLTVLAFAGAMRWEHAERAELVSWYWHFVDVVWIVVFSVVYVIGR